MRHSLTAGLLAAAVFAGPAAAQDDPCQPGEMLIRFAHVVAAQGHPKGEAAAELARRVNTELDGRACMIVYPDSTLYDDDAVLGALQSGEVELAAPSLSKFESLTLSFRIFDLPFLFEDIWAVERFQQSPAGQQLMRSMENAGILGLTYWHNGMKQISANRPLRRPEDAAGLRFRIQASAVLAAQFEALGAEAVPMAFKDVYAALADGTVDGQENSWTNIYTKQFYTVQDGITETNHGIIDYLLVTSVDWLDSLDKGVRDQFLQIVAEVTATRNKESTAVNAAAREAVIKAGGTVRTLDAGQRAAWVEAMKPVWAKFEGDVGADNIAAAQKANAMLN